MSRMLLTGLVLLMLSGWCFRAVLTAARPGRLLLGDTMYQWWPLQPSECVLIGLGLGLTGLGLAGFSGQGRRLVAVWRGRGVSSAILPPRKPTSVVTLSPAFPHPRQTDTIDHRKPASVAIPSSVEVDTGDHHGI